MSNLNIGFKGKANFDLLIVGAFSSKERVNLDHWSADLKNLAKKSKALKNYKGGHQKQMLFPFKNGSMVLALGFGDKKSLTLEKLRVTISSCFLGLKSAPYSNIFIDIESMKFNENLEEITKVISEALTLADYQFNTYKKSDNLNQAKVTLYFPTTVANKAIQGAFKTGVLIANNVNLARDFVSEPPNVLNSIEFASRVEKDASKLSRVKVKILKKKEIEKEKMNLLLSVNRGSAFEPRVAHLTYTPEKANLKTKHIALVGKGLTFDSGGYSLKPSASMIGMKFDMAGAATVYAAFKTAVMMKSPYKISCFLGITDNMVAPFANTPDTIIKGRSGKTVEILNTDAEGRLVLADVLDYCCDFKPDIIIDSATLTGACIRALGHVAGIMGNSDELIGSILDSAKSVDEKAWQLPLIDEYRDEIKSSIADIKNIGSSGYAGAQTAAAFLEHFVKKSIKWAHIDIAGVDTANHLPYCPKGSPTGLMVRTIANYLLS